MVGDPLLSMSRADLVSRATSLGVERADRMTRPELRDEILRRTKSGVEATEARGLFGIARSMLASMMETGLKMPEAAALIRGTQSLSAHVATSPPVATVTLAEIYAAQGHPDRALTMLESVLETEPDHWEARRLRESLAEARSSSPSLALRSDAQSAVLETTGEEVQTGQPPAVESRSEPAVVVPDETVPEASAHPIAPVASSLDAGPPVEPPVSGPELHGELGMSAEGSELVLRCECSATQFDAGLVPFVKVIAFRSQKGRPYVEEARVPLSRTAERAAWSGSARLPGFFGASVSAALGFMRAAAFVPLAQATLARGAWGIDSSGGERR